VAPWPLRAGLSALGALSPALAGRAGARLFLTPPRHVVPRRERAALAAAEPFALRHRGHALRGWTLGAGPAVLLVHGWGGRSGQLAPIAHTLAAAGCTAVAFDAPAHGRSGGRTTSMVGFAEAAADVAGRFGARAAVGHSVGGAAVAFAAAHGLDLAAAALLAPPRTPVAFVDQLAGALRLSAPVRAALDDRIVRRVGVPLDAVDVARLAPRDPPPVLVVHDAGDLEVPLAAGAAVAEAWRARLIVTSGLGHQRILRDQAVVNDLVAFVTSPLARCGCGRLAWPWGEDGIPRCEGCALANDLWDRERRRARIRAAAGTRAAV
jgi:pimeloyl-ACP methyl ester carboxylesterase